jgi:hypothetical protein
MSVAFVDRKMALNQVYETQAEFAAQNGVISAIMELEQYAAWLRNPGILNLSFSYPDESRTDVTLHPWGSLILAESDGKSHSQHGFRRALLASEPGGTFSNALVLGNTDHSLVLTGTSTIVGDVVVGKAGVSTGSLQNHRTPGRIPITGNVAVSNQSRLPDFDFPILNNQVNLFEQLLEGDPHLTTLADDALTLMRWGEGVLSVEMIPDSVGLVECLGGVMIVGSLRRQRAPLYIVVRGPATIRAELAGPAAICASDSILVEPEALLLHSLIYSRRRLDLKAVNQSTAQFIAPRIYVGQNCRLSYPSALVSFSRPTGRPEFQFISLAAGAHVEGTVLLVGGNASDPARSLIDIDGSAKVIGSILTDQYVTLDGEVQGSLITHDLYFYEPPTTYLGWIRTGRIDRSALPDGFLVSPNMADGQKLEILTWM